MFSDPSVAVKLAGPPGAVGKAFERRRRSMMALSFSLCCVLKTMISSILMARQAWGR